MKVKEGLYYTKDHEWLEVKENRGIIGITDYAQEELGDITWIELPEKGKSVSKGEETCVIECVKTTADVKTPISGEIIEVNNALEDSPEKINEDPYGTWIVKIKIKDKDEIKSLMNAEEYKEYLKNL